MQVVSSFSVKKEEGEIGWVHGELDKVNEEIETIYKDTDYEIKTEDLEEPEHINQYVLTSLDWEPLPGHLLPPGWSTTSSSLLCPPPALYFYFTSRRCAYQALTSSSASPQVGLITWESADASKKIQLLFTQLILEVPNIISF